ncbi:hypothetical protein GCM10011361_00920 [Muriicola marianensis]|uniref:RHS repeat protein n=2 Tax=Muriicola marianensis TaxID=1324801 RepID=A0ABQ1QPN2_9FLAO|nr:hypothetical protein GCM10011361_00920 [Muriicola marianensis]
MGRGQEPKVFSTRDYGLSGKVKRCLVITDYGKEAFDFREDGLLEKITTVYSEKDYDITYYRYKDSSLIEKRIENYREDKLDRQTSIAHLFRVDTVGNKIIREQIYSYQKEFLDQFEYAYDTLGNLTGITRTSNEGIDHTLISYDTLKREVTRTVEVNGLIEKSVRTAEKKEKDRTLKVELVKEYLKGDPFRATETFRDTMGRKLRELEYTYDGEKDSFVKSVEWVFTYGERGFLKSRVRKQGKQESKQEYIYQFDAHDPPNWTKEIITPQNQYTTRRITYYEEEASGKATNGEKGR